MSPVAEQASLFGYGEPRIDPGFRGMRRIPLDAGAWLEHLPGWLEGHQALFEVLRDTTRWAHQRRRMYERVVDVPRLVAGLPEDGPGHPVLAQATAALSERYGLPLDQISLAYYRDGRDSVAWHGDRLGRLADDTVVAILSVGTPRHFLLRPAFSGGRPAFSGGQPAPAGASRAFDLGWGDLLVMGGSCQRTWQHAVPKAAFAEPRMSIQFRPDVESEA
jgi:alkylated DNA repair dioxygenase AlkB